MSRAAGRAVVGLCVLLWLLVPAAHAQEAIAPAADGFVTGKVIDKGTGEPLIDAGVEVMGANKRARTDLDGKYSIKIPPGTYQVRFFAALYQGARFDDVKVVAGQKSTVDAALAPEGKGAGVETVEVVAKADKQAESIQLIERKNAAVVSDNIGAQTIKESPDSNAAEVVERVPAVTVRDNKYVYVRGLGERYSQALLNGSKLPSTDPNKRVVPLDLFPAEFIESLSILKGYTPDLPGDFSGGLVDIKLREPPEKLSYSLGVSASGDTNTTFNSFQNYPGTSGDVFGFGKGSRSLPGIVPNHDIDGCSVSGQPSICDQQMRTYAGAFKNVWTPDSQTAPPNFGLNASIGDTFGPLGLSLAGLWNNEYQTHPTEIDNTFTSGGVSDPLEPQQLFTYHRSTQIGRLGGVLTSSYTINSDNRINFRALDDHVGTDYVLDGFGTDRTLSSDTQQAQQTTLYYQEQNLGYGQLQGEHHLYGATIDWRSALSQTTLDAPDSRYLTRQLNQDGIYTFAPGSNSGLRTFLDLNEYLTDSAVDFTIPFATGLPYTDVWSGLPAKFQFGPAYTYRKRNLTYRRFRFNSQSTQYPVNTAGPAETFLIPANVGRDRQFSFVEDTRDSDKFTATQEIAAIYGLVDTPIIPDQLRLIAGVRVEYSYIATDGFFVNGDPANTRLNNLNPLPGVNLVYSPRNDMNVRFGWSKTVSRPEFRELTPTLFVEPLGIRNVIGNPDLQQAEIGSYDLRWEWFLSPLEVVSFGAFYKNLNQPIEQIVISQSSSVADSWINAESANLEGFEFELRKDFGFLAEPVAEHVSGRLADQMRNFSLLTNVSYVYSNVTVPINPGKAQLQAEPNRQLQGLAPFVVNASLQYELPNIATARLLYNTAGSNIFAAGTLTNTPNGMGGFVVFPGIIQDQRGELDFVLTSVIDVFNVPINAKFTVENMLNAAYEQTQGSEITTRYRNGVQFGVSFGYSFN